MHSFHEEQAQQKGEGEGPLAVAVPRVVFIVIRTWPFLRRRPRFFAS